MKKTICLLLFSVCLFSGAFAQSKQESIKELFHITKNDSMVSKMLDSMSPIILSQIQIQSQPKDSIARTKSAERMTIIMQSVKEIIPQMLSDMELIYSKNFTEKEIKDLIVFYKSPSGQKYLNLSPEIMKEFMGTMTQKYMPEMLKTVKAKMVELKNNENK